MTIPSEDQFKACLGKLSGDDCFSAVDLSDEFHRGLFFDVNDSEGRELVAKVLRRRNEAWIQLEQDPIFQWLNSQGAYSHAYRKFFLDVIRENESLERKKIDVDDYHLRESQKIYMSRLCESAKNKGFRFRHVVNDFTSLKTPARMWWSCLISALHEYHYSEMADNVVKYRKNFSKTLEQAAVGLKALERLAEDPAVMDVLEMLPQHLSLRNIKNQSEVIQLLSSLNNPASIYPIVRDDATARERFFVYRMHRANSRLFRSSKAEGIASLLLIEGFKVALDVRGINKLCRQFKEDRRQLWQQIDALTASDVDI
ncbi:hypothetical protein [Burkholderia glumae]|uniref:hypothetical protein n=1 Tax=Burkholderia glumae TaxID=337 RepID=UPI00156EB941|nr:hypothetical protein [Burkholderia glumae]QKM52177.1 hypothetical protein CG017_00166 [Burkholderia glumae]